MNTATKMLLASVSVVSLGALTACQSTNNLSEPNARYAHKIDKKHANLTTEQRQQIKQKHAYHKELKQQFKQACDQKALNSTVQVKVGEQTIQGTCNLQFYPERQIKGKEKSAKPQHHHDKAKMHVRTAEPRYHMGLRGEALTDEKRRALVKRYDQRLAEQQATQNAMRQACDGQKDGQKIQIKLGDREINGQCAVKFKPTPVPKGAAQPTS